LLMVGAGLWRLSHPAPRLPYRAEVGVVTVVTVVTVQVSALRGWLRGWLPYPRVGGYGWRLPAVLCRS